jgi:hypothetical protein
MVNLIEHHFADHAPRNANGLEPFTVSGDFSSPNDAYFDYAESLVKLAASKGLIVLLCPAYLGGDGGIEGWYAEMLRNGPDKLRAYGEYVGRRFRGDDNLIWLEGGDFTPPAANLGLVDAVAEGIRRSAPAQLQSAHWSPETSGVEVRNSGWLDINTTYTYLPVYLKCMDDYNRARTIPQFLVESRYEDEQNATQKQIRAQAYYALLSGAMGHVFGNRWIWQFVSPSLSRKLLHRTWVTALDSAGARSMSLMHALTANLRWWTLEPDLTNEVLVRGQLNKGNWDHASLAWSHDGKLALVYLPTVREIELDLTKLARPLRARWYDPTSGKSSTATDVVAAVKSQTFKPPGVNAAGDTDWVLLLEAGFGS